MAVTDESDSVQIINLPRFDLKMLTAARMAVNLAVKIEIKNRIIANQRYFVDFIIWINY